jgi:hypothetical protein
LQDHWRELALPKICCDLKDNRTPCASIGLLGEVPNLKFKISDSNEAETEWEIQVRRATKGTIAWSCQVHTD